MFILRTSWGSSVEDWERAQVVGTNLTCHPTILPAFLQMRLFVHSALHTFIIILYFFSFILLIHEGSHREAYQNFQPSLTSSAGGAKGFSDHRFRAPPAGLYCPIANSASTQSQQPVNRRRLIKCSRLAATLEQFPIQVRTNRAQRCLTSVIIRELVFPN